MKNYKFVLGFLLSVPVSCFVHAASITPDTESNRAAISTKGGGSPAIQTVNSPPPTPHGVAPTVNMLTVARADTPAILPLNNFLRDQTLAKAFHYLDGSGDAAQGLRDQNKLATATALVEDVSEPASEILLLAGLSALAIAVRRQSKS